MKRTNYLLAAIATILTLNLLLTGVTVANQSRLISNQVKISSHLDALTSHVAEVSGEIRETPSTEVELEIHLRATHRDKDGNIKMFSEHAGTLTTIGKNYIEDLLGNNGTDPSSDRISLSASSNSPAAAWEGLPAEIAANNLSRASSTYASTGDGAWTITKLFTASGTQEVRLAGLHWGPSGNGTLLCADSITLASMVDDDTLELEFSLSVS